VADVRRLLLRITTTTTTRALCSPVVAVVTVVVLRMRRLPGTIAISDLINLHDHDLTVPLLQSSYFA